MTHPIVINETNPIQILQKMLLKHSHAGNTYFIARAVTLHTASAITKAASTVSDKRNYEMIFFKVSNFEKPKIK